MVHSTTTIIPATSLPVILVVLIVAGWGCGGQRSAAHVDDNLDIRLPDTRQDIQTWHCGKHDSDDVTATLKDDGTLIVSGTGDMQDYRLVDENSTFFAPWSNDNACIDSVLNAIPEDPVPEEALFCACTAASVIIEDGVTSIGTRAFRGCTRLESVTIPASVKFIGEDAFEYCTRLTSITVAEDNPHYYSVDGVLFRKQMLSSRMVSALTRYPPGRQGAYTIPDWVPFIENGAFAGCTGLISVTIPNDVILIGERAFAGCTGLTAVTIPGSVAQIGKSAFSRCYGLTSLTIHNGVGRIGESAFNACTSLVSVTISSGVTSIDEKAFRGCINLESVTIPTSVEFIGDDAFEYCPRLASIDVSSNNPQFSSVDGVLFSKDRKCLIRYPEGKQNTMYTIPNTVTVIGESAFKDCRNLTSVAIPGSVIFIYGWAFSGCTNLTTVTIPDRITEISEFTFSGCANVTSISIPSSVNIIKDRAFNGAHRLASITSLNLTPPKIFGEAFGHAPSGVCLYVPENSIGAYRAAYGWKKFECIKNPASAPRGE